MLLNYHVARLGKKIKLKIPKTVGKKFPEHSNNATDIDLQMLMKFFLLKNVKVNPSKITKTPVSKKLISNPFKEVS